eukprot:TRINITY_DN28138_c0_g1_i1.p1 TRINITY_DN28138_c0_g1~~TRINITY_DN28138_c0_g1_i1.p1  ORF type:complete len:528 (+),score=149.53 TRINITY_DN28138_c0_g1_i1:125-1708(+)
MGLKLRDAYGPAPAKAVPPAREKRAPLAPLKKSAVRVDHEAIHHRRLDAARAIAEDRAKRELFLSATVPLSTSVSPRLAGRHEKGGFKHMINGKEAPITVANAQATLRQRSSLLPRDAAAVRVGRPGSAASSSAPSSRRTSNRGGASEKAQAVTVPQRMRRHLLVLHHLNQDRERHAAYHWLADRAGFGCSMPRPLDQDSAEAQRGYLTAEAQPQPLSYHQTVHDAYTTLADRYVKGLLRDYEDVEIDPEEPTQWPVCDPLSASVQIDPAADAASPAAEEPAPAEEEPTAAASPGRRAPDPQIGAVPYIAPAMGNSKRCIMDILGPDGGKARRRKYIWKPPKKHRFRPRASQKFLFDKTFDPYVSVDIPRPGSAFDVSAETQPYPSEGGTPPASPPPARPHSAAAAALPSSSPAFHQPQLASCKRKARGILDLHGAGTHPPRDDSYTLSNSTPASTTQGHPTPLYEASGGNVAMSPTALPAASFMGMPPPAGPLEAEEDYLLLAAAEDLGEDIGSVVASSTTAGDYY